jgi:hypothetical protein
MGTTRRQASLGNVGRRENGCIAGRYARKRRIAELEAERQKIEAQMGQVQPTGSLSKLNAQDAEIIKEIERLNKMAD